MTAVCAGAEFNGDDVLELVRDYCEDNMVPAKDLFS